MKISKTLFAMLAILFANIIIAQNDEAPENWFNLDFEKDGVRGVSAEKAYEELLKGKKSKTIVVSIIDSGVDEEHEDLKDVMWVNEGEKPGNGIDDDGNITTLGRGGSDTTAVALAAATKANECQIYTDVDGVYTTDPRVEPNARRLEKITFEEMLELASLGSKVLQIRAVEFAGKYAVPLRVLSSFEEYSLV